MTIRSWNVAKFMGGTCNIKGSLQYNYIVMSLVSIYSLKVALFLLVTWDIEVNYI